LAVVLAAFTFSLCFGLACAFSLPDVRNDASAAQPLPPDTGTIADAGDAGAIKLGFCDSHPQATLCSDFDNADPLLRWSQGPVGVHVLEVSSALWKSPPRSLHSQEGIPGSADASSAGALLVFTLPKSATRTRLTFSMNLRALNGPRPDVVTLAAFLCCRTPLDCDGAWLFGRSDGTTPSVSLETDQAKTSTPLLGLRMNDWVSFVLDATWGAAGLVSASVDGTLGATVPVVDCTGFPTFDVRLGLSGAGGMGGEAFYDDVLVEVDPP
jgi:hypothetical protein